MNTRPEIVFHGMDRSQWVEDYIGERLQRLDRFANGITRAQVTMTRAQSSRHKGNVYGVLIDVRLPPNHELAVKKERIVGDMQMQLRPLIKAAFDAIERQLKQTAEKRRYAVKTHGETPRAVVDETYSES
jgi:ribosome-associated translation inhibitor RaiA